MFIARISKGRTIRQFVIYVIVVPSLVSFVWFSIMAGSAYGLQFNEGVDLGAIVNSDGGTERVLFETLRGYPLASITVVLAVFLIAIFFITGADSASIVMGMLSQHGTEHPMRWLVVFWGVAQGAVAAVLLWSGGLSALQTLVIIVAGPFMLVIVAMCFSLMKALRGRALTSPRCPRACGEPCCTPSSTTSRCTRAWRSPFSAPTRTRRHRIRSIVFQPRLILHPPWTPRDRTTGGSSRGFPERARTGRGLAATALRALTRPPGRGRRLTRRSVVGGSMPRRRSARAPRPARRARPR